MSRPSLASVVGFALAAGSPALSHALGLGDIEVVSHLNEPFRAVVRITGTTPDELSTLKVRIADAQTFLERGIDHPAFLDTTQVRVTQDPDGSAQILLQSSAPFTEPLVCLPIAIEGPHARLVREFTILLDPAISFGPAVLAKQSSPSGAAEPEVPLESEPPTVAPARSSAGEAPADSVPATSLHEVQEDHTNEVAPASKSAAKARTAHVRVKRKTAHSTSGKQAPARSSPQIEALRKQAEELEAELRAVNAQIAQRNEEIDALVRSVATAPTQSLPVALAPPAKRASARPERRPSPQPEFVSRTQRSYVSWPALTAIVVILAVAAYAAVRRRSRRRSVATTRMADSGSPSAPPIQLAAAAKADVPAASVQPTDATEEIRDIDILEPRADPRGVNSTRAERLYGTALDYDLSFDALENTEEIVNMPSQLKDRSQFVERRTSVADALKAALARDPTRTDLLVQLMELYHSEVTTNRRAFLRSFRDAELRPQTLTPAQWSRLQALRAQVAPEEEASEQSAEDLQVPKRA